ncbi:TrkA family potassium uptake protein [Vreelandella titanicae]|uniref:potassium channel family protein n=1 Tax=Halomonadaceae TaxID=28256 RepID=UPI00048761B9|nr:MULTISPECIES: TrkA family potassium uptake protein [unclassified Halomonas]NAO97925.1 TrkA family potassium uptake protein [Halomonas sp. MG34]PKH60999.1 TrkA family potassium uptake protein [Halomonas sp. Choline-3u-9]QGQ70909.1 TrkA family potassium uptake protein [Halomonas sp. PA16-9]|tara:strand:+ start:1010 stop:1663 length:654 start_codon:yes stop_codon:yes gene_type:complete
MIEKQQFIVIGLGIFGATIARELTQLGHEVLGIDADELRVNRLADEITHAVIADVTDENALIELNAGNYDAAVVAIGRNVEAAMLATLQLQELGVTKVWTKALTNQHHRVLERLGATRIIAPEYEMGVRISQELNYPMVHDYLNLGKDYVVVEFHTTEDLIGKTIGKIIEDVDVAALVVKRNTEVHAHPGLDWEIRRGDRLVLGGWLDELRKLVKNL